MPGTLSTCINTMFPVMNFHAAEPPKITSQPTSQDHVRTEDSVAFSVQATGTELVYQWQWKQFGKKGEKDGWQNLSRKGSTFQVVEVQACNAGYYRCVVSNSAGSDTSQCAILTVGENVYCCHTYA